MSEPVKINAGDTVEFTVSLPDYPASEYSLYYKIVGRTSITAEIQAAANGDDFNVTIPSSATTSFAKGTYRLVGYVTKTGFQKNVYDQPLEIALNYAALTTATDTREYWQQVLDAIQATMLRRATKEQSTMTLPGITGKTIQYATMDELIKAEAHARYQLTLASNGGRSKKILPTFLPTS